MNQETKKLIHQYKVQIVLLFVIIIALLITVTILKLLIDVAKGCRNIQQEEEKILERSRISAILILIVTFYFLYYAFKTYREKANNINFIYVVAAILIIIAALLRVLNLFSPQVSISGAEDVD